MKQQINSVYEQIRLPAQASQRIRAGLEKEASELMGKGMENMKRQKNISVRKKVLVSVIAAAVICAVPAGVYAANNIISFIAGSGQISDGGATVTFDTGSLDSYLKVVDGRLILDPDGQKIDITDELSETEPYIYTIQPGDDTTHYLIIGGTLDNYGVAEYVRGNDGQWQGGFSSHATGEWYVNGARQLELPWLDMIIQNEQRMQAENSSGSEG